MSKATSASGQRLIGVLLVLLAAGLGLGQEWALRRDLSYAAAIAPRIDASGNSEMRASVAYHEANARAAARARWSLLGHGTLGVAGVLIGMAIIATARRPRDA